MFPISSNINLDSKRMVSLDALRGIAILLMVTGHTFVFLASNKDNTLNDYFIRWHMPLFATISGYVSLKATITSSQAILKVKKRILQQIFPTIILCVIWTSTLSPANWHDTLNGMYKGGYWYTFVALELYIIYTVILLCVRKSANSIVIQASIYFLIIIGTPILEKILFLFNITPSPRWLIPNLLLLLPFFSLGCFLRVISIYICRVLNRKKLSFIVLSSIITVDILILYHGIYSHHSVYVRFLTSLCPILTFMLPFIAFANRLEHVRIIQKLSIYGKDSIEIYLLHFFILALLGMAFDLTFLSDYITDTFFYILLALIALPVAALCLYLTRFFNKVGVYKYLFFTEKRAQTSPKQTKN